MWNMISIFFKNIRCTYQVRAVYCKGNDEKKSSDRPKNKSASRTNNKKPGAKRKIYIKKSVYGMATNQ